MKKTFQIKGMNCNSCAMLIEKELKDKVNSVSASYSKEQAEVDFDENKISGDEIKDKIKALGYEVADKNQDKNINNNYEEYKDLTQDKEKTSGDKIKDKTKSLNHVLVDNEDNNEEETEEDDEIRILENKLAEKKEEA